MGIDLALSHAIFPLSFQSVDPGHPHQLKSPTSLHPYVVTKINHTSTKRVNCCSTHRSNQVLKLTDYHISRHVASTFKRLTKCAKHRDLNQFQLHQRGITTTRTHLLSLYFSSNESQSNPRFSRKAGNLSTSTVPS